jgi:hypothetical protein
MDAREAFRSLFETVSASHEHFSHLRSIPTAHMRRAQRERLEALPAFVALKKALPGSDALELLERSGTLDQLLDGEVHFEDAWSAFESSRTRNNEVVSLLHLNGVVPIQGAVELADGSKLIRFTEAEWLTLQPKLRSEQIDPGVVVRQTFLRHDGRPLLNLPAHPGFSIRDRELRCDPLWDDWWKPLLGLSLYSPEFFSDGVRLEIEPLWRLRREGDFSEYGDIFPPQDDEDGPESWRPYESDRYEIGEGEQRERFRTFVNRIMAAADRALKRDGERVAVAAKRFLSASFRLAAHGGWKRGPFDTYEHVLFDLVRAADGTLVAGKKPKKSSFTDTFTDRVTRASGIKWLKLEEFLKDAYRDRSALAHADATPKPRDVAKLHEVIREALIGYFGCAEAGVKPDEMKEDGLPAQVNELRAFSLRGSRDPPRQGVNVPGT